MHLQLQSLFDSIERETDRLLTQVTALPEEDYYRTPAPGKWSVAQIVTHLMIAERLSLLYMRKKSMGINEVKDSGLMEEAKFRLLKLSQRLPIRFKAPKALMDHTPEALSQAEIRVQWEKSRKHLQSFLSGLDEKHLRRLIYKHAVAGRLNVIQALRFFIEHIHHHQPQIDRIIRSSKR